MICLDISYRGLVKLATDAGSIEWAKAVLVYEGDKFIWNGPNKEPTHEADVFNEKRINAADPLANLKGGYCLAKLKDGFMVDVMTAGEIMEVKNSSKAKKGPWAGKWAGEMAKKTLIKRAYKSWPQSGGRARLDEAINILNQHEGLEETEQQTVEYLQHSKEDEAEFNARLAGDPVDYLLWWRKLDDLIKISLYNSFPKGEKTKGKQACAAIEDKGQSIFADMLDALTEACETEDEMGAREILEVIDANQQKALIESLDIGLVRFATGLVQVA
jgi:hypothetical protein